MILRNLVANFGKPSSGAMVRVIRTSNGYIRYNEWKAAEDARLAQLEASKRIPGSQETYDLTFRAGQSQKASYDFTF